MYYSFDIVALKGLVIIGDCRAAQIALPNAQQPVHFTQSHLRLWNAHYGAPPIVCVALLNILRDRGDRVKMSHLFWALLLLKTYPTENVLASKIGVTRKTARIHSWSIIYKLHALSSRLVSKLKSRVFAIYCYRSFSFDLKIANFHVYIP